MTEHIASHLQVLMLLTLRFANLENISEDLDNDIGSEYADFDSEDSVIAKGNDMDRLMEIASEPEEVIESEDWETLDPAEDAMDPNGVAMGGDMAAPDSDFDFSVVPRQYDDLPIEDDAFLKKVVESGACQSWKREVNQKLFTAAEKGNKAVVRSTPEFGADKNARGRDGDTPLHSAARKCHEAVVRLLIEAGADKEARSDNSETPLFIAAKFGNEAAVRLLLQAGADKEVKDSAEQTPLHMAAFWDFNWGVLRTLIGDGAYKEAKDKNGDTPLHWAAQMGSEKAAIMLMEAGADKETHNRWNQTPLHVAIQEHASSIARLLIEAGADTEAENGDGYRPLHCAARFNRAAMVRLLVEAGADVEAESKDGKTPLRIAFEAGHVTMVKLLKDPQPVPASREEGVSKRWSGIVQKTFNRRL
ncbi:hypothetical protein N3K66_001877 [Trichothecium roseum]|uniref:Uncharacterized protein n=1 Tax=Trichothecium roseum TaxID=47278 RepID=A0ACC0V9X5_9HYPO|nr:hypothetical protein N3K66_001877 [Trichothecium roseum]